MNIIAEHNATKKFSDFWKSVNKLNLKPSLPVSVEECNTPEKIAGMFREHFKVAPLGFSQTVISADTCEDGTFISFSAKQVKAVINSMQRGKSPGHDGLSIDHLKHAGVHLPRVLALFLTMCIRHTYLPSDLMRTIVVPIVKNKTGDLSDKFNYRPISLGTITGKILDSLLNNTLNNYVTINDAQFGFQPKLSTESAILCLKQTVQYYTDRRTPVYACFLDLSRAFDLVIYEVLWDKLRRKGVPSELLNIFKFWYSEQLNAVRWGNTLSKTYGLRCGVRQGGLSSPKLFNLYVNDLIAELCSSHVGCWVDGVCVNNISYADDMVLLAPTAGALRQLLKICESYASKHGLIYNVNKSEYLVFKASGIVLDYEPRITLKGSSLNIVEKFKYLGHYVTADLKDQVDVERERRALAVKGNMLVHRFAGCSREAKISLFKAYCQTFYTSSLWTNCTKKALNELRVQYNNIFRMLMGLPRFCSASEMFAQAHTDDYYGCIRKRAASLYARIYGSSNSILRMFCCKWDSPLLKHFMQVLVHPP